MNKTLYMTYKKPVPTFVFERWTKLNPSYTIDFSLDEDCISFLRAHFNEYIVTLFKNIPVGMFKADLWRLCKLYIYGGSYADVDLIPHISLETLNKDITFYACLSAHEKSIFQAFMIQNKPRSPLLLCFLLSFLHNRPYTKPNGPTYDMYRCLAYNVRKNEINELNEIKPEEKYSFNEIKIDITIGSSDNYIKYIDLHYFPEDVDYTLQLHSHTTANHFDMVIYNNKLIVIRKDMETGWDYNHRVDICIKTNESFYLFTEHYGETWIQSYVSHNQKKILDSHDEVYVAQKGW